VREYIWENFGGGSFRSGSENGLSLIPVDFSNLRAIYDYKDLSFDSRASSETDTVKGCCHQAILYCHPGMQARLRRRTG